MVIFPDIEKTLVAYFNSALAAVGSEIATGVRVATKKAQPDDEQPSKEIVITAGWDSEDNYVLKSAIVTIQVFASDYSDANELGLLVESLSRGCVGDAIKRAEVRLGPVRIADEGAQEKRFIELAVMVKGTTL